MRSQARIAPGANLTLYTSQDTTFQAGLNLAIQRALDDNAINILNVSFGACEAYLGQSGNLEIFNFWQQAAAQGISVTVSTGDSGAAGCDNPNIETTATQGLEVSGFASTPYNIAVGGTDFNQNSTNESKYWSTTNSTIGGSALGPIPEIPWNDSTSTIGALSGNMPTTIQGGTNISGAGGGFSACLNADLDQNSNVTACPDSAQAPGFYAKPSWQSSFGTQNARQIPDVSLFAADGLHDSAWVICASGLGGNPTGTDCTPDAQGSFNFQVVGGTSASSPAFAGALALVIQQLGGANVRLGQADYTLYPLSKQFPAAFHDVTTGNISVVCARKLAPDCGTNGFLTGFDAGSWLRPRDRPGQRGRHPDGPELVEHQIHADNNLTDSQRRDQPDQHPARRIGECWCNGEQLRRNAHRQRGSGRQRWYQRHIGSSSAGNHSFAFRPDAQQWNRNG